MTDLTIQTLKVYLILRLIIILFAGKKVRMGINIMNIRSLTLEKYLEKMQQQ